MDNHLVIQADTAKEVADKLPTFAGVASTDSGYPTTDNTNTTANTSASAYCVAASASYSS